MGWNVMKKLTRQTLEDIRDSFPSIGWGQDDLQELVAPKFGIITGFSELQSEIGRLLTVDLGLTPPAGPLRPNEDQ